MGNFNVELDWIRDELFFGRDRVGTAIPIGRSIDREPDWRGVKASDLLVLSLLSCSSHDIVGILRKQRQKIQDMRVTAQAEQDDDPPWRFRKIRISYRFKGHDLDRAKVEKAIELSENNYCSVYATLRDSVEITTDLHIEHI